MTRFYSTLGFMAAISLSVAIGSVVAHEPASREKSVKKVDADHGSGAVSPNIPEPTSPLEGIDLSAMRLLGKDYVQKLEDGRRIYFTLDPELQRFSDSLFDKYKVPAGAVVALNSRTGRVLALSQKRWSVTAADMKAVALDSSPPAASIFKIITAAALLEKGGVTLDTETCYRGGSQKLVMENLEDAPRSKSACVSLTSALGGSINAVFAKLSDRRLDRNTLGDYAHRFGFNRPIPFDVPVELSNAEISEDRLERARTAAGFWHTHLSPLHAAMIAQSLAQGGAMLKPYIVDHVETESGKLVYESRPQFMGHTVSRDTAMELVRAMTHTVRRGTARKAFRDRRGVSFLPGIAVAGKTGTLTGAKPYRAYTWFVGIAPVEKPEIALAVLVVNEPRWRIKASQTAVWVLKKYFDISRKRG